MRWEQPLFSLFSLAAAPAMFVALRARWAPPPPAPPASGYALSMRVQVALRAAARARR